MISKLDSLNFPQRSRERGKHQSAEQTADVPPVVDAGQGPYDEQIDRRNKNYVSDRAPKPSREHFAVLDQEHCFSTEQTKDRSGCAHRVSAGEQERDNVSGKRADQIKQ